MKSKPLKNLDVYYRNLAKYEAAGDLERAAIQRRLIARLEAD